MYKVKNFNNPNPYDLQAEIKEWVENENHIKLIISVNIWGDETHQATIVYLEKE